MSQSRELKAHIAKLAEIRDILTAMKNLSLIETHKLTRILPLQNDCVAVIEQTADDFLRFFTAPAGGRPPASVRLVLGSERGFCGDFNSSLLAADAVPASARLIAVGSKLAGALSDEQRATVIAGANVAEEVPDVVNRILDALTPTANEASRPRLADLTLTAVYRDDPGGNIRQRRLLPLDPPAGDAASRYPHPPLLTLPPDDFFAELSGHYLLSMLHAVLYQSLIAENLRRAQHLEGAISHLDQQIAGLHRKSQVYRQEEITEEIEVILLNAEAV